IHDYFDIRNYDVYREMADQQIDDLSLSLMSRLLNNSQSIREIASEFDADTHLPFGSGVTLFYHLLAKKIMVTDMYKRSKEHTSELQSRFDLVCRLLLLNK